MTGRSPPLRFLTAVVGGWAAVRAAMLAPLWPAAATIERPPAPAEAPRREAAATGQPLRIPVPLAAAAPLSTPVRLAVPVLPLRQGPMSVAAILLQPEPVPLGARSPLAGAPLSGHPAAPPPRSHHRAGRWSASAWAFVRRGDEAAALASAGTLGGSQVGARLSYRLGGSASRPLSLSARLSAPARRPKGAEAALGIEWQPVGGLPLRLLVERRQALGGEGRSAFALLAHGGVHDRPVAAGLRLDAYAQAGIVGARSRDLFADGGMRLSLPLGEDGPIRLGGGAWAAMQPGIARLDAGPSASLRLPGATLTLEWRLRLAGDAAPGSGPTATLSTDF